MRAIEIGERTLGKEHPDLSVWLNNLALLYAATGRHAESQRLFSQALLIEDKKRENVFAVLSEKQKLSYMKRTEDNIYAFISHSAQNKGDPEVTLDAWLRWKGAVHEAQGRYLSALIESPNPEIKQKFAELISIRRMLAKIGFSDKGNLTLEDYRGKIENLEKEKQRLEIELSRLSKDFSLENLSGKADTKKIAELLPLDVAYIDFANIYFYDFQKRNRGKEHYLVFILTGGDSIHVNLIDIGESEKINSHINAYLSEMKSPLIFGALPNNEILKKDSRALYDALITPIAGYLKDKKKLYISPDSNLSLMPFEVLTSPSGEYLIEDYLITYITAGRDIVRFSDTTLAEGIVLIMADPDFDMAEALPKAKGVKKPLPLLSKEASTLRFQRLPDTKEEADEIQKTLRTRYTVFNYQDKKAVEEMLFGNKTPRIIHLATHGFFLKDVEVKEDAQRLGMLSESWIGKEPLSIENPMLRSGIVFAGANTSLKEGKDEGIVSAEKILGLRLNGTELVVLSACDTGTGDVKKGEGVFGLKRAFILAGAKTLLMSLWSVPSKETKDIMIEFYTSMAKGKTKAEALREAKLNMLKGENPNPFFWAPFILVGKP
ncbi:MAG: CHAT domain-containing protein [Nitrospirae bacterium]|nr:CHAT domain-containing protein [Nitrospirota bacterium]